jgi:hypothetical protein
MYEQLDTQSYLNSHNTMMTNAIEYGLYSSGATGTRTVTTSSTGTIGNFMATVAIKSGKIGPTIRGTNTPMNGGSSGGAGGSSTLVANYPGGDFFVVATCFKRSTVGAFTVSAPAGWTLIASEDHSASDGSRCDVWYGWRAGGATSVTITASGSATGMFGMGNIVTIPDDGIAIDKGDPVGASSIVYSNTASATETIGGLTTTVPMSLSHMVVFDWDSAAVFGYPIRGTPHRTTYLDTVQRRRPHGLAAHPATELCLNRPRWTMLRFLKLPLAQLFTIAARAPSSRRMSSM